MTDQEREWHQEISDRERLAWRGTTPEPMATLLGRYEFSLARKQMRLQRAEQLLAQLQYLTQYNREQYEAIADFLQGY